MFELLFKYPASIFHKGHFVLLTPWPLWALGLAILAAAGLLFWHVRRNHGMLSGLRPVAIWLLETGMVALILFLLWHPALSVATLRPQQNVVAVLVDDSRSMSIADSSGTREAAAKAVLDSGLLKSLGDKFQVRLYKFGKEPERIQKTTELAADAPASRIGDTLERVLAESSSLPLGAIVLLSDGADNAGGIDLADHRRHPPPAHPGPHHRLRPRASRERRGDRGRHRPGARPAAIQADRGGDACRATASRAAKRASAFEMTGRSWPPRRSRSRATARSRPRPWCSTAGTPVPRLSRSRSSPSPAKRTPGTTRSAAWSTWNRASRASSISKASRAGSTSSSGARSTTTPTSSLPACCAPPQNKIYRQGFHERAKELEDGFPSKPEELFQFQGLIIGSVEANYFTPTQQQLIHDFVDRRGGGLLFTRRARLALRRRLPEFAPGGPGPRPVCPRARARSTAISPARF